MSLARECTCDADGPSAWSHSLWCPLHPMLPPSENEVRNFAESLRPRVHTIILNGEPDHVMTAAQRSSWLCGAELSYFNWVEYVPA